MVRDKEAYNYKEDRRKSRVEEKQQVGDNIRRYREGRFPGRGGIAACAKEFGVMPQQWSGWELGRRMPDHNSRIKLAKFFGVTEQDLCRIENPSANARYAGHQDVVAISHSTASNAAVGNTAHATEGQTLFALPNEFMDRLAADIARQIAPKVASYLLEEFNKKLTVGLFLSDDGENKRDRR